ncbi:hypothetical protein [Candidatus Electronema sp. JC]|uniref:hypothetical protein n=1 Tax=Candidatus Electronema sp. JC TaxID=3401570 RepID=UPI003B43A787
MNTQRFMKICSAAAVFCCFSAFDADEGSAKGNEDKDHHIKRHQHKEQKPPGEEQRHEGGRGSYFQEHGYAHLNIPARYYPRLGECRIWRPDRSAERQSPPVRCGQIPLPGAWLIQRHKDRPNHVQVTVYEPQRPGVVFAVGEFEIRSGAFLRDMPHR